MLRILNRIARTGNLTEPLDASASLEALGIAVRRTLDARFAGSLAIRHIDAGSCNGCE
ncbi:Ni-Fe hydrogenase, small subunit HycG, partial [mine drainage metagenome]